MNEPDAAEGPTTPHTTTLLANALAALAADAVAARLNATGWLPATDQVPIAQHHIYDAVARDWSTKPALVQLACEAAPIVGRMRFLARLGLSECSPDLLALGDAYVRRRNFLKLSQDSINVHS